MDRKIKTIQPEHLSMLLMILRYLNL